MVQLHEHLGVIGMDAIDHTREARDHAHVRSRELARLSNARQLINATDLRNDQTDAALGAFFIKTGDLFRCFARSCGKTGSHRGHDDAVLDRQLSDFAFLKKLFVFHNYLLKSVCIFRER